MKRATAGMVLFIIAAAPSPALCQQRPISPVTGPRRAPSDRVFVSVNGGYQVASNDFSDGKSFPENAETARFDTTYTVGSGPTFDVTGGAVVWRTVGAGLGVTRFSRLTPTTLTGSIPHPFFFNRPRSVTGEVSTLRREELAIHFQVRGVIPITNRVRASVFGGPTFFKSKQDVVDDVEIAESYPYDVAAFDRAVASTASASKLGFHLGGDVGYFFTRQLGVGFGAQFARATIDVPSAGGGSMALRVGGLQAGGGLRLRF